jgi:hypothetical protein
MKVKLTAIAAVCFSLTLTSLMWATAASADFVGSQTITFEDYGEGTPITNQYESDGIIFSGSSSSEPPLIAWDTSSSTNPVLSGNPIFHGPIHGEFVIPGTSVPSTVDGLAMDVGFIDDPGSVQLIVETTTGSETITANEYGFDHLETSTPNITGFIVEEASPDEDGYEIDNVSFTPPAVPIPPVPPPTPTPSPAPTPVAPPAPVVSLNPCAITHGSIAHDFLASLKCAGEQTKLEVECGFAIAMLDPLNVFGDAKTADGLYDLRKIKQKYRPIAKLYNDIMSAKFGKNAPAGFRTGAEVIDKIKNARTAYAIIKLLPNIARAVSKGDFSQIALDVADITGLKPCVQGIVNGLD